MEGKEIKNCKELFATLLAKNIGTDEDPNVAAEMIGNDLELTALYNTCLEFSAQVNETLEAKTKSVIAELKKAKEESCTITDADFKIIELQAQLEKATELIKKIHESRVLYISRQDLDEEVGEFYLQFIDNKGVQKPSTPIGMRCEYPNCNKHEGNDYKRLPSEEEVGWEDEPIFLCDEHAKNREL